jgi:hypothetical protein
MKAQVNFDSLGGGNAQCVIPQITNNNRTLSGQWGIDAHFFVMIFNPMTSYKQVWLVNLDTLDWWIAFNATSPYTAGGNYYKNATKVNVQSNFTWTLSGKSLTIALSNDFNASDVLWILTEDIPSALF